MSAPDLEVLLHGLRLRGESYAADVIERLSAPVSDAQVEAATRKLFDFDGLAGRWTDYRLWMRAALEAAREVSGE